MRAAQTLPLARMVRVERKNSAAWARAPATSSGISVLCAGGEFADDRVKVGRNFERVAGECVDAGRCGGLIGAHVVVDDALRQLHGHADDATPAADSDGYIPDREAG